MPSDRELHQEIQTLRDAAIAKTVMIPDLPPGVEQAAMCMEYDDACIYMEQHGFPVEGLKSSCVTLIARRRPPRAGWNLTLGRSYRAGEFTWQLNAGCHRVPDPSDRSFLDSVKNMLGIPESAKQIPNEFAPMSERLQHFVWIWNEIGAN
jgi:hypothetical protein